MGVLVRQESGKTGWWVIAVKDGIRKKKRFNDQKSARDFARQMETSLAAGKPLDSPQGVLFSTYFSNWLETVIKAHRKPSTYEQYKVSYDKYFLPLLGHRPLQSITRSDVRSVLLAMQEDGKSKNTMRAYFAPLSAVFNYAIEEELVARNPVFRLVKQGRGDDQSKAAHPLSEAQLAHLLLTCKQHFPGRYPILLILARAGLRIGEMITLRRADLDFSTHVIHVRRTYSRKSTGKDYSPKSGKYRVVPMSVELENTLKRWLASQGDAQEIVFPNQKGRLLNPNNFRHREWSRLFIKAQMTKVRVHDLRHTFATHLIERGVPIVQVKEMLGHSSIKVTVDTYGHLNSAQYRAAVNLLDSEKEGAGEGHFSEI